MYNNLYRCVKTFAVYDSSDQHPIKIERASVWKIMWGGYFKELYNKDKKLTVVIPDSHVKRYFKKI